MSDDEKTKFTDIFWRKNLVYPDAASIFTFRPKLAEEVKDDCYVVLDTNVLLIPYTTGEHSLDQIKNIYSKLAANKRLVIPGQVAREFADNRVNKLKDLYQQILKKKNTEPLSLGTYPLLGNLDAFKKATESQREVNKSLRNFNKAIDEVLEAIMKWYWDDPVSKLYGELFVADLVADPECDEAALKARLERNIEYKLPPAYKDAAKMDSGIGDLIIWDTILGLAKDQKKSVIFVSGEQKPDWVNVIEKQALYPRYELVNEFYLASEGQSFHIIKFSDFLKLFGATDEVVEEIRKEESVQQIGNLPTPPISNRIVRAWLDSIINPLCVRFEEEVEILQDKRWYWDTHNRRIENLYITLSKHTPYLDTMKQFFNFYPIIQENIVRRDQELNKLNNLSKHLRELILNNLQFLEIYKRAKADETQDDLGIPVNKNLIGGLGDDFHTNQIATYVFNRYGKLSTSSSYRSVWNKYGDEMLAILESEPLCHLSKAIEETAATMLNIVCHLCQLLGEIRNHLSLSFGEPIHE